MKRKKQSELTKRHGRVLPGFNVCGAWHAADSVRLLIDDTFYDPKAGCRVMRHEILDAMLDQIASAEQFIVADFFLWNAWQGKTDAGSVYRAVSDELTRALLKRKSERPGLRMLVITDPLNRIYGGALPSCLAKLQQAGIPLVFTDLTQLPHSNRIYSLPAGFLRLLLRPLKIPDPDIVANPFDSRPRRISLGQLCALLHFKANHRKVLVSDRGGRLCVTVGSFNPSDSSSAHSNMGVQLCGAVAADALRSELDCAEWSESGLLGDRAVFHGTLESLRAWLPEAIAETQESGQARWLTERAVRNALLGALERSGADDEIRIALFYLSDAAVIRQLCRAARKGARVRVILDANRDAFGRRKNGVPNRPVAARLVRAGVEVRWADTHGEQFHCKAVSFTGPSGGRRELLAGSANWTRRNIGGFNMEADVQLRDAPENTARFNQWFDQVWNNAGGMGRSLDYASCAIGGLRLAVLSLLAKFQERSGLGTF